MAEKEDGDHHVVLSRNTLPARLRSKKSAKNFPILKYVFPGCCKSCKRGFMKKSLHQRRADFRKMLADTDEKYDYADNAKISCAITSEEYSLWF